MERLLVLRLEARGCEAEASLNGVPLARAGVARPAVTLPVHEFALGGDNELTLVVHPPPPGAAATPEPRLSDGQAWAGLRLLLPRIGQLAHPSNARTLAQIDWALPEGELYEAPAQMQRTVALPITFPRWRWLDAPALDDPAPLLGDAAALLQRLALDLARGQPDPFVSAARLRFEELALAYQRNLPDEVGRWREHVRTLVAGGPFKPVLVSATTLHLRPVAGRRLLECLTADGLPALRGSAGGRQWQWPLRVAAIDGRLHVLR